MPTPQVEQVQVEPQEPVVEQPAEPQQQPPTPTIKTEPTIEENDALVSGSPRGKSSLDLQLKFSLFFYF